MYRDLFLFVDRDEAGEKLAAVLQDEPLIRETARAELLVLSIPRGGVVVGAAIARALGCAHDVIVVKKIGFPGQDELAIGAIAEEGVVILSEQVTNWDKLDKRYIKQKEDWVKTKIKTYIKLFRRGRPLSPGSKTVIVADDGIATGETMKAAVAWLLSQEQAQRPKHVLIAVPVCSPKVFGECEHLVDRVVCLSIPKQFWAVGQFYWNFDQVSDDEVLKKLWKNQEPLMPFDDLLAEA